MEIAKQVRRLAPLDVCLRFQLSVFSKHCLRSYAPMPVSYTMKRVSEAREDRHFAQRLTRGLVESIEPGASVVYKVWIRNLQSEVLLGRA